MASGSITSWQIEGEKVEIMTDFIFLDSKTPTECDCSHEIKRRLLFGRKAMTNLDSILKMQRHHFANTGLYSQSHGFSSSQVWMWEMGHKESLALKNWCFWTVVLEKTLESPSDFKEMKSVNSKPWIFIRGTVAEAPMLWPPDAQNWLTGKDSDAGKDWKQRKRAAADEVIR